MTTPAPSALSAANASSATPDFRLTYSTMFDPPAALHAAFEASLARIEPTLGQDHPVIIAGAPRNGAGWLSVHSPIDRKRLLARFARATRRDVDDAVSAARAAWRGWAATPWTERVALLRKVAAIIEARVYDLAAVVAIEVGKNRMEAIGEVQETADLITWYCDRMAEADGFDRLLPNDPLVGVISRNRTVLKPYGVWAVIAPFNFPFALAGAPIAAALVTGNTALFKVASETALSGWLLMDCFREAGLPPGVLGYLTGSGGDVGEALARHPDVAGITFTGSSEIGRALLAHYAGGRWPRPCLAEMGGKNAVVVTRHADLDQAATGIVRSAFGLSGQKCSACSRVYVDKSVAEALRSRLIEATERVKVGDPTERQHWMGPVINAAAVSRYRKAAERLAAEGLVDHGGRVLTDDGLAAGHFVAPTLARAGLDDPLWREELFAPFVLVGEVDSLDAGIDAANRSDYGLTAGFYGGQDEIATFLDRIEAGVTYVNRPQGATTGAWPGYQPFGGWKASGTTGKAIGSFWYLPQYLREQSQTIVDP